MKFGENFEVMTSNAGESCHELNKPMDIIKTVYLNRTVIPIFMGPLGGKLMNFLSKYYEMKFIYEKSVLSFITSKKFPL